MSHSEKGSKKGENINNKIEKETKLLNIKRKKEESPGTDGNESVESKKSIKNNEIQTFEKKLKFSKIFEIKNKKRNQLISFTTAKNKAEDLLKNTLNLSKVAFHKIFYFSDINAKANFLYLKFLKENDNEKFGKYNDKYKYTLEYKDAKFLNFFQNEEEQEIAKLLEYRQKNKIEGRIKMINSLAKLKLINFLYQLNDYYKIGKKETDFKNLLFEYKIKELLKFKLPNNYGNDELKFYTYLQLFFYLFFFEDEDSEENSAYKDNANYNNVEEYFSSSDDDEEVDIIPDLSFNYDEYKQKIEKFNSFITLDSVETQIPNKDTIQYKRHFRVDFSTSIVNIKYLNQFDEYITNELILYEEDNIVLLGKIEFIYYTIIYFIYNYEGYSSDIINFKFTLFEPKNIREKCYQFFSKKTKTFINNYKEKEMLNYTELLGKNKINVENIIDNPICNIEKCFKYPLILKKNIIIFEEKFFNSFKNFIFEIYQSKLMKQIFYSTEELDNYYYPFEGKEKKEIFNEMFSNTEFYPFKIDQLHGYTCKIFSKVIISTILKDNSSLERIIISISFILNTILHEQAKHYIKTLIHYNSLRQNNITPLESDDKLKNESLDKYIKILKKKKELIECSKISKEEFEEILYSDGGDKLELFLYGQKLQRLFIKAALKMLCLETYNVDISEHLKDFINDNKSMKFIPINNYFRNEYSFLNHLIEYIKRYSDHRISKQIFLDGNCCLQKSSFACQDPGSEFLEFKRISIRGFMGTS